MPNYPSRPRFRHQSHQPRFSVVVPAYNEAENIPILVEKFVETFRQNRLFGEVVIVDDGSTDRTYLRAREYQEKFRYIRVISHKTNMGLTAALQTGFQAARADVLVFYPADLQYLPEDLPKLLNRLNEGYDIVTGWRQGHYGLKRFVSFVYNLLSRLLFRMKVHDLNSIKAFRREVIEAIPFRRDWHRYFVVIAAERGFKISEVKVRLYPRKYGKSKFGFWRIPVGMLDLIAVKFQISFMQKPLLFFGSIGLFLLGLAVLVGVVAVILRFGLDEGYRPLLYLVMLLASIGMVNFALGFLAEGLQIIREKLEDLEKKLPATPAAVVQSPPQLPRPRPQMRPQPQFPQPRPPAQEPQAPPGEPETMQS